MKLYVPPLADIEAELDRRKSRTLAGFIQRAWHIIEPATDLKWGWAMDAICAHLEAVTRGDIKRLLTNVPPGSMKSLITNVFWPAWEWGPMKMPHKRFLATAHKQDLAVRDNMKCRRLIQSKWYQSKWPVLIADDQNAKTKFENDHTGFREAMAFTSMTGSRGDRVILDDPHSVDDANSPAKLAAAITTFREALPSRVNNDDSAIVIIMQRLHENDVSAVALDLGYEHLCIPMRFELERRCTTSIGWTDPRTTDGELMFPERFPERTVDLLERAMGPYATAGQHQQRPTPREGGTFQPDMITIVDALPAGVVEWMRGWDLGATSDGDYTAGAKLGRLIDGRFIIADMRREQYTPDKRDALIKNTAMTDGRAVPISIPQDPGQAGKSLAVHHTKLLAGFSIQTSPESGDKISRADPFAAQVNVGNVLMLRGEWNQAVTDEMRVFPMGKHDDQIDALSRAFNDMTLQDVSNSGFLALIRQENAERIVQELEARLPATQRGGECPYAPGSMEYNEWHAGT